jgi:hypothetical protein
MNPAQSRRRRGSLKGEKDKRGVGCGRWRKCECGRACVRSFKISAPEYAAAKILIAKSVTFTAKVILMARRTAATLPAFEPSSLTAAAVMLSAGRARAEVVEACSALTTVGMISLETRAAAAS